MKDRKDIEDRYEQFRCMELPGQPMSMHMGTSYLVNDLHNALTETEAERDRLRKAIETHRRNKWGEGGVGHYEDVRLYDALQEAEG